MPFYTSSSQAPSDLLLRGWKNVGLRFTTPTEAKEGKYVDKESPHTSVELDAVGDLRFILQPFTNAVVDLVKVTTEYMGGTTPCRT